MLTKPSRIWQAFEAAPGLIRAAADWRCLLGPDYEKVRPHLRARQDLATAAPCPAKPGCGCTHGVVEHKRDDLVSVCRCSPRRCPTTPIDRAEVVIYELHHASLGAAIAGALGVKSEGKACPELRSTWQVGTYAPRTGLRIPLFLTMQSDPEEFRLVVTTLASSDRGPFVLLAPTEDSWKPEYHGLLRDKKSRLLSLAEIIDWNGKLAAKQPIEKILADLLEQVLPAAAEETVFRRERDFWRIVYEGVSVNLRHSTGLACIAQLLQNPNQDMTAAVLQASTAGTLSPSPASANELHDAEVDEQYSSRTAGRDVVSAGAHLDQQALGEYKARMEDIEEQLREAGANNDTGRVDSLKRELSQLSQEVGRATGLHGQLRRNDDGERSRKAVSNAIHRALTAMKKSHPVLEQHLSRSIRIAEVLSYNPEKPIAWAA